MGVVLGGDNILLATNTLLAACFSLYRTLLVPVYIYVICLAPVCISVYYLQYYSHSFAYISFYLLLLGSRWYGILSGSTFLQHSFSKVVCYCCLLSRNYLPLPSLSSLPLHLSLPCSFPHPTQELFRPSTPTVPKPWHHLSRWIMLLGTSQVLAKQPVGRTLFSSFMASHLQSLNETTFQRGSFTTAFEKSFTQLSSSIEHMMCKIRHNSSNQVSNPIVSHTNHQHHKCFKWFIFRHNLFHSRCFMSLSLKKIKQGRSDILVWVRTEWTPFTLAATLLPWQYRQQL